MFTADPYPRAQNAKQDRQDSARRNEEYARQYYEQANVRNEATDAQRQITDLQAEMRAALHRISQLEQALIRLQNPQSNIGQVPIYSSAIRY